jgi:3-oxoadipate enol-lactonase
MSNVMANQQGYAPAGDTALYYEVIGKGPAIVLMHGFSFDRRMWDEQVSPLAQRHTVVRYDLRGFGQSAPGSERYTHADDLGALLDHLGIENAALMGLSLGGGAAINFAITRPERVRALVVVDPSLGGFKWSPEFIAAQGALRTTAGNKGVEAARAQWLSLPMFEPAMMRAASAARVRSIVNDYSGWHWLNADHGRPFDPPAITRLAEIRAPTLLVVGELDTPDFQGIASALEQGIPGARKIVLNGVGHMANLENPDRFNEVVLGFLASLDAPGR